MILRRGIEEVFEGAKLKKNLLEKDLKKQNLKKKKKRRI